MADLFSTQLLPMGHNFLRGSVGHQGCQASAAQVMGTQRGKAAAGSCWIVQELRNSIHSWDALRGKPTIDSAGLLWSTPQYLLGLVYQRILSNNYINILNWPGISEHSTICQETPCLSIIPNHNPPLAIIDSHWYRQKPSMANQQPSHIIINHYWQSYYQASSSQSHNWQPLLNHIES